MGNIRNGTHTTFESIEKVWKKSNDCISREHKAFTMTIIPHINIQGVSSGTLKV